MSNVAGAAAGYLLDSIAWSSVCMFFVPLLAVFDTLSPPLADCPASHQLLYGTREGVPAASSRFLAFLPAPNNLLTEPTKAFLPPHVSLQA